MVQEHANAYFLVSHGSDPARRSVMALMSNARAETLKEVHTLYIHFYIMYTLYIRTDHTRLGRAVCPPDAPLFLWLQLTHAEAMCNHLAAFHALLTLALYDGHDEVPAPLPTPLLSTSRPTPPSLAPPH